MRAWISAFFVVVFVSHAAAQQPDIARATELYNAAQKALDEGRGEDAARDFLAAYEITKDPVVFFKIGSAYEKAGKCDEATSYYKRYLEEAKPEPKFVDMTTERISACATKPAAPAAEPAQPPAASTTPAAPAELPPEKPSKTKDAAWLLVGGGLAFITAGAVLAYSAKSSEQDIRDLYVSSGGEPPVFDAQTQERYDELVAEGKRYQYLSWTAFGIATGCAIASAILFWRDARDDDARVSITPVIAPNRGGIAATLRF